MAISDCSKGTTFWSCYMLTYKSISLARQRQALSQAWSRVCVLFLSDFQRGSSVSAFLEVPYCSHRSVSVLLNR